jgi:hypothetical protein
MCVLFSFPVMQHLPPVLEPLRPLMLADPMLWLCSMKPSHPMMLLLFPSRMWVCSSMDWFRFASRLSGFSRRVCLSSVVSISFLWVSWWLIWKEWNKRYFEHKEASVLQMAALIQESIHLQSLSNSALFSLGGEVLPFAALSDCFAALLAALFCS